MCVWVVLIPDVVEELDLVTRSEEGSGDGVHWCIAPALCQVKEFSEGGFEIGE